MTSLPTLFDVYRAQRTIRSMIVDTPLVSSPDLAE